MTIGEFIQFLNSEMKKNGTPVRERPIIIEAILRVVKTEAQIEAFLKGYKPDSL